MNNHNEYYFVENGENQEHLRFASEFSYYHPIDHPWNIYYIKYFIGIDKAQFPYVLELHKKDKTEKISIIKFFYIDQMPQDFYAHHNHWILLIIAELSTGERVILPCC